MKLVPKPKLIFSAVSGVCSQDVVCHYYDDFTYRPVKAPGAFLSIVDEREGRWEVVDGKVVTDITDPKYVPRGTKYYWTHSGPTQDAYRAYLNRVILG